MAERRGRYKKLSLDCLGSATKIQQAMDDLISLLAASSPELTDGHQGEVLPGGHLIGSGPWVVVLFTDFDLLELAVEQKLTTAYC